MDFKRVTLIGGVCVELKGWPDELCYTAYRHFTDETKIQENKLIFASQAVIRSKASLF